MRFLEYLLSSKDHISSAIFRHVLLCPLSVRLAVSSAARVPFYGLLGCVLPRGTSSDYPSPLSRTYGCFGNRDIVFQLDSGLQNHLSSQKNRGITVLSSKNTTVLPNFSEPSSVLSAARLGSFRKVKTPPSSILSHTF